MMAGGYQNPGTAAAGGKGGTMGGFDPGSMAGAGKGGESLGSSGTAGGMGQTATTPAIPDAGVDMTQTAPVAPVAPAAPQGPNAFEQGLGAQDNAMAFFQNAMGGGASDIMDMINSMSQGGGIHIPMGGGASFSGPAYQMKVPGQDLYSYDPTMAEGQSYQAAQLSDQDLSQYMNPYTQSVIDSSMKDLDMARQTALNSTGAAATRGGAFGGDRHGIMEAQNNRDYMDSVARTSSQLRNQAFQNAQNAARGDVNAQNQALASNAAMAQQANMANAAAQNQRDQFVGSTANANAMAAEQGALQSATQMAKMGGNSGMQAAQLQQRNKEMALQAAMSMYGMQFDAANQLYGMGQDRWGMGENATNSMANVGAQIDGINQNLIDAVRQQWDTQMGAPQNQFNAYLSALAGAPGQGGGTQSYSPGKMDFLGLGTQLGAAALMGSDVRLKENIQKVATVNGINLYSWDWNEDGKSNFPGQKPFGVLAQEIAETRPEAVVENADGWLMVDYRKLPEVARSVMGA